jgi:death-on-curing protein
MNASPDFASVAFLSVADVLEIHEDQISRYGGAADIRDTGLLLSAVAQPEAAFGGEFLHEFPFEMAAATCSTSCKTIRSSMATNGPERRPRLFFST